MKMITIIPVPAFTDNYIWMLINNGYAVAVDPGDANITINWLEHTGLKLCAVLNTHHHKDHTGGNARLRELYRIPIYGPAKDPIPTLTHSLVDGDTLTIDEIGISLRIMEIPGHTLGHIGYIGENFVLCGDTLFSAGCGRIFEGNPSMMLNSLDKLAHLPANTQVYCTHEYTLSNLRFAKHIEPENLKLRQYDMNAISLRKQNLPTLPSTIEIERNINPFLRCCIANVALAAKKLYGANPDDIISVFSALREAKNNF